MTLEHILINLKRELIRTFAVVDEWFDKENPLCAYKPSLGGWSINEVLEHVMLTNHFLLIIIEKGREQALRKASVQAAFNTLEGYSLSTDRLLEVGQPGAFVWERPEHHQPSGQQPVHNIRREIRNQLNDCLFTLELLPNGEGVLHKIAMSVNNLGKLDVYQFIYFLALHGQRHIQQMKKIEQEFVGEHQRV